MKTIHIELSYEGIYVSMSKIKRKNVLLESVNILDGKLSSSMNPMDYFLEFFILNYSHITSKISKVFCMKLATLLSTI